MVQGVFETLIVTLLPKKLPDFMEPRNSYVCKASLLGRVLGQFGPVIHFAPYFFRVHLGIALPSTPVFLRDCSIALRWATG
jgi:hypothetical protein